MITAWRCRKIAAAITDWAWAAVRPSCSTRGAPGGGQTLTQREREVLTLVAGGRSNHQIAQELAMSAKTASVHVSRIIAKLGVTTRSEAAAVARRLRLIG